MFSRGATKDVVAPRENTLTSRGIDPFEEDADSLFQGFGMTVLMDQPVIAQPGFELAKGQGLRIEISLREVTTGCHEVSFLAFGFHPFGDAVHPEGIGDADDGGHNGRIVGFAVDMVDEGLIDFDRMNGEPLQIAEAGVTGAEIIDGNRRVVPTQLQEMLDGQIGLRHDGAFRQFDFEQRRIKPMMRQQTREMVA